MRSPVSRFRSITGPYNSGRSVGLVDTRPYADLVGSARESQWCPTIDTHQGSMIGERRATRTNFSASPRGLQWVSQSRFTVSSRCCPSE